MINSPTPRRWRALSKLHKKKTKSQPKLCQSMTKRCQSKRKSASSIKRKRLSAINVGPTGRSKKKRMRLGKRCTNKEGNKRWRQQKPLKNRVKRSMPSSGSNSANRQSKRLNSRNNNISNGDKNVNESSNGGPSSPLLPLGSPFWSLPITVLMNV